MATDPNQIPKDETTSPSTEASGGNTASDFKFGTDAPEWARGKTAQEVLGIASQLAGVVQSYTQQPPPAPPAAAPQQIDPEGYVTGQQLQQFGQNAVSAYQGQLSGLVEMQAQTNLSLVQREFAKEFDKYGPEIHTQLAGLRDKNLWTIDNLKKVVKYVRADHVEELAREQAARLVAEMEPGLGRSSGAATVPGPTTTELTIKSESLPADWRERAAKVGLTEQALDEFCRANEMSRADWFKMFDKTAIPEVTRRG